MLSQANEKNKELESLVTYFQNECSKHCKNIDWVAFVRSIQDKDEQIKGYQKRVEGLEKELNGVKNTYNEERKVIT